MPLKSMRDSFFMKYSFFTCPQSLLVQQQYASLILELGSKLSSFLKIIV